MTPPNDGKPLIRGMPVDVKADLALSPTVHYGEPFSSLLFPVEDGRKGRVTFETLDALRVCRGEHPPYDQATDSPLFWVSTVDNSPWLRERYLYESTYYRDAYEFDGDVDEMLRDFSHYLFTFHDEFVEAIASGIWIDVAWDALDGKDVPANHPFLPLPESAVTDYLRVHDLVCQVRRNPLDPDQLIKNARLCSQPLLHFALELDGEAKVGWQLSLRLRAGQPISVLRSTFGRVEAEFDGVADLAATRGHVENWIREVRDRRRSMGK